MSLFNFKTYFLGHSNCSSTFIQRRAVYAKDRERSNSAEHHINHSDHVNFSVDVFHVLNVLNNTVCDVLPNDKTLANIKPKEERAGTIGL